MFWRLLEDARPGKSTFEEGFPWIVYHYRSTDRRTRITGRSVIYCECAICGAFERVVMKIPRIGPVPKPEGGRHERRKEFLDRHRHPEHSRNPLTWARPLLNLKAFDHFYGVAT
jgi:hypothetical protein